MSPPKTHSKSHSFFCFCQTRQWTPDLGQRFCLGPEGKGRGCPWNGWFHRHCSDRSKWWVRPRLRDNKSFCCFCMKIYERLEKEKREKREIWARQKREQLEKQEQKEARLRWRMLAVSQDDTNKQMESDASSVTLGHEDWPKFRTLRRDSGYESDRLTTSGGLQQSIKRPCDSGHVETPPKRQYTCNYMLAASEPIPLSPSGVLQDNRATSAAAANEAPKPPAQAFTPSTRGASPSRIAYARTAELRARVTTL